MLPLGVTLLSACSGEHEGGEVKTSMQADKALKQSLAVREEDNFCLVYSQKNKTEWGQQNDAPKPKHKSMIPAARQICAYMMVTVGAAAST